MIKREIGTTRVLHGQAEYKWQITDDISPGKKKIYVTYLEDDGYMLGEAWENAYIRTPTIVLLGETEITVNPTTDMSSPSRVVLTASVNTRNTMEAVTGGSVQFQAKTSEDDTYQNIGTPQEVVNGEATYEYEIPTTSGTTILIKAIYITRKESEYGSCETETPETIHVRKKIELTLNDIRAINPGDTETIVATLRDEDGGELSGGEVRFYLDDTEIASINSLSGVKIEFEHTFSEEISTGNHVLRMDYLENENYVGASVTAQVYVRQIVVIDDSVVHAPQSLPESEGVARIPLNVTSTTGERIPLGVVEVTVNGVVYSRALDVEEQEYVDYVVPQNYHGGDEIPFTIRYVENDNYQECTVESKIIVKYKTFLTLIDTDDFDWDIGEEVTLSANVLCEDPEVIVDGGIVRFELETVEEDNGSQNANPDEEEGDDGGSGNNNENNGNEEVPSDNEPENGDDNNTNPDNPDNDNNNDDNNTDDDPVDNGLEPPEVGDLD